MSIATQGWDTGTYFLTRGFQLSWVVPLEPAWKTEQENVFIHTTLYQNSVATFKDMQQMLLQQSEKSLKKY